MWVIDRGYPRANAYSNPLFGNEFGKSGVPF